MRSKAKLISRAFLFSRFDQADVVPSNLIALVRSTLRLLIFSLASCFQFFSDYATLNETVVHGKSMFSLRYSDRFGNWRGLKKIFADESPIKSIKDATRIRGKVKVLLIFVRPNWQIPNHISPVTDIPEMLCSLSSDAFTNVTSWY